MSSAGTVHNVMEFAFSEDDFELTVNKEGESTPNTLLHWKDMDNYVTSDSIAIPYKVVTIEVPQLSRSFEINEINAHHCNTINYNYPLQQVKFDYYNELLRERPESSILRNLESHQVEIIDEYFIKGTHYIKVALTPIKYDLHKREIYVYDSLNFKINFKECPEDEMDFNIYHSSDEKKKSIVSGLQLKQYVIITTNTFKSICEDMALWKTEQGYDCRVICIDEIFANPDFAVGNTTGIIDEADAIRHYLSSIYQQNEMYCLFVGDTQKDMPFRYFFNSSSRVGEKGDLHYTNFIPSDLYFSDLTKKWTYRKEDNGIYTIPLTNINYSPDIYVGRIMCSTEEELKNYFNKLLIYESFPGRGDDEYLDTALVFKQAQHLGYPDLVESIAKFKTVLKFQDNKNNDFDLKYPTGQDIIRGLKRCGLSSWQGHGNPGSVQCSGENEEADMNRRYIKSRESYPGSSMWLSDRENNNGLDLMDNIDYPSVVYSLSCYIAPFDDFSDMHLKYNMATSFTVGGSYGGVALIGNSRTGYDDANKLFETCFANTAMSASIGRAHAFAKKNSNTTIRYALAAHNIIGDPTLNIWIGKPNRFSPNLSKNQNTLSIYDSNLQDASVVLFDGNKSVFVNSESTNLNINTLQMSNAIDDKILLISIFKRQYLPELLLLGQNFVLKNSSKKFICKNAYLGKDVLNGKEVGSAIISDNCNLDIRSIDSVNLEEGFAVESNGNVQVACDGSIELSGVSIKDNGKLNLTGQTVVLKSGTTIGKGASVKINVK